MSLVKCTNKKTGVTYVYESESYWDKEKKQPRAKRTLIGKIDEETGEIIPTGKRGKETQDPSDVPKSFPEAIPNYTAILQEKDAKISELTKENRKLRKEIDSIAQELEGILEHCKTWNNEG